MEETEPVHAYQHGEFQSHGSEVQGISDRMLLDMEQGEIPKQAPIGHAHGTVGCRSTPQYYIGPPGLITLVT